LEGDTPLMLGQLIVCLLLYADDFALMSHTPAGLQKQLDVLQAFCYEHQLTMNVKKTKVVVFEARKSVCQAFQYEGEAIEQLNSFKYLGVELHGTKGMQAAIQRLTMSRKKVVFALRHKCAKLRIFDLALQCQLFDALVKPVLSYGCKIWSDHIAREQLEVVHRAFLKLLLGSAPQHIVTSCWQSLTGFL